MTMLVTMFQLSITARNGYNRIRVTTVQFTNNIATFFIGVFSYRTAINYANISRLSRGYSLKTSLLKLACNGRALRKIKFTTERMEINFFSHIITFYTANIIKRWLKWCFSDKKSVFLPCYMDFLIDILQYRYLTNAVIACILSGITCGIVGTYIVARRMVFLSGGITHASFGGLGIAFYLGTNPIAGALIFAILSSLGIEYASSNSKIRNDSAIGVMWGIGMAIGAFFISLRPGYTSGDLSSFLFGNIISVTSADIWALAVLTIALLIGAILWLKPVMYVAFDREFAHSAAINTRLVNYIMAVIVAVTIVLSIRVMGIVLLVSLMTMPVLIANTISKQYSTITITASIIGALGALAGIVISYYLEVPSGPAIIFVLTLLLIIVKLLSLRPKS